MYNTVKGLGRLLRDGLLFAVVAILVNWAVLTPINTVLPASSTDFIDLLLILFIIGPLIVWPLYRRIRARYLHWK